PFPKTRTSSCLIIGLYFAIWKPLGFTLSHTHEYLNHFGLLITNALVNGWFAVNTIAPLSLITRSYCSHKGSKGIIVSHLHAVVPYGKSAKIISTEPSGISFINSKQSPCISFMLIINHSFQSHTVRVARFLLRFAPVQPCCPIRHSAYLIVSCAR